MTFGLLDHPVSGINQNDGQVGCAGPGYHVSGVLDVPWRVGNDELPFWRGKVSVCHVNGDALLAFGPQAVRK